MTVSVQLRKGHLMMVVGNDSNPWLWQPKSLCSLTTTLCGTALLIWLKMNGHVMTDEIQIVISDQAVRGLKCQTDEFKFYSIDKEK